MSQKEGIGFLAQHDAIAFSTAVVRQNVTHGIEMGCVLGKQSDVKYKMYMRTTNQQKYKLIWQLDSYFSVFMLQKWKWWSGFPGTESDQLEIVTKLRVEGGACKTECIVVSSCVKRIPISHILIYFQLLTRNYHSILTTFCGKCNSFCQIYPFISLTKKNFF